jgi:serine/threonine protein phosphatase PrpC
MATSSAASPDKQMTKPKEEKDDSIPAEGVDLSNLSAVEQEAASKLVAYAVESRKGVVPYNRNKVNQDRALCKFALQGANDMCLFGVMDGHGEFGHFVAGNVQDKLPPNLIAQPQLRTNPAAAILTATDATCKLLAKSGINCTFSGTTCVFGVKIDDRLFVANVRALFPVPCSHS